MQDDEITMQNNDTSDDVTFEPSEESENLKDPIETVKKLKEEIKSLRKERAEYLLGWQRAQADYANLTKEASQSKAEFAKFAEERLVRELIPAMQSFQGAFSNKEAWEKVDANWRKGVEYIYSQFLTALEQGGLSLIDPKIGSAFDPLLHASVDVTPVTDKKDDHTIQVCVQKGFSLRGKVLEPAKVTVGEHKES